MNNIHTMRSTISRRSGFTLIEIMIVVAIIGLLAAVAIPNLVKAQRTAKRTVCIQQLKTIEGAKIEWVLDSKKGDNDVPGDGDLFGPGKNMTKKPECPAGGTYNLGTVAEQPKCSIADHALP